MSAALPSHNASIPSWFGIFVHKALTSMVHRIMSAGRQPLLLP